MAVSPETLQRVAAEMAGLPLPDDQAKILAPLYGAAVENLARIPDEPLLNVEPQLWFRPLPRPQPPGSEEGRR